MNTEMEDLKKVIDIKEQQHQDLLLKHDNVISQLQQEKVNTDYK